MKKKTRGAEDATLRAYLREIADFPTLTSEQERALGRRIRRHRDQRAFRRLVESNLRLVAGYARIYRGLGVVLLDLIDEASIGLMEAARRFDPERNGHFGAYAQWWIREAIMHALAVDGPVFVVPRKAAPLLRGVRAGDLPPANRTAANADGSAFRGVNEAHQLLQDPCVRQAIVEQVGDALAELTEREADVIRLRLGLNGARPLSAEETARRLRVPPDRLLDIEDRARRKLRRSQKARQLRTALN